MMRFARLAALAALAGSAAAQNATVLTQLVQQLESMNLTSLINATTSINSTSAGQQLLSQLGNGTQTLFAPNNAGWAGAHPNITSNPSLLAAVLSYHVLPGQFNTTSEFPNTTVGRTFLSSSSEEVFLEGNKNQVLAWTNENGTTHILNQNTPVQVTNTSTVGNLTINVVDAVIDLPGEFTAAIAANNLTSFSSALSQAGLLDTLNLMHGVTIFAPNDAAFSAVQQNLTSAGSNVTVLQTILKNHVINGTSVYSGELIALGSGSNDTTAAGEGIGATFNSTGGFVTNGNVTAKIVTPDIILWNGVMHIVDHVFFNEESNEAAASSAVSSASSAAAASTTESGPIGFTPTPTSASGSGSSGSTSSAAQSKANLIGGPLGSLSAAGVVSLVSVVLGAVLVL